MVLAKRLLENEVKFMPTKTGKIYSSRMSGDVAKPDPVHNTLSKQFLLRVKEFGNDTAMRKKRYGIWREYSWNDVYEHVSSFFHGLKAMGLQAGETVAIIGENDPETYWAQMAAHAASAMSCGIFADALPEPDLVFAIKSTNATFLVAHDQEQVDKALQIKEKVPQIRKVIYWEDKGMWSYQDEWLMSFADVEAMGKEHRQKQPKLFEETIAQTKPEDTIILSMTSGTTSLPKFAMITNHDIIWRHVINRRFAPLTHEDNWLSFSPMAWLTEQAFGFTPFLMEGFTVNFPEGSQTVQTDLREIAPVGLLFPSRVWENLASTVRFRLNDSSWLNRKLFEIFLPTSYQIIDLEDEGKSIPPHLSFLRWLGEMAVFEPLRDKLGLVRARNVLTAGAMLSPDVIRFFRAIGVELRQLYASTETIGTIHLEGDVKLETVGVIVPGVEVKITDDDQEILVRSEGQFAGYYRQPDKTAEAVDEEGWYHTGDAGYMREDGHLVYLERVADMIELANGHKFSPQFIEGRLKFSPYIQDIMTIGGFDMEFVSAIVVINFENVARWAEKRSMSFTTFVDLSQKPEIYELIKQDIVRVNASLPPQGRVKKFVILHKEFDADEGELTRTRKLKRRTLFQKYADILEALYGDREKVSVRAEVKYRDGRTGVIETELTVMDVD